MRALITGASRGGIGGQVALELARSASLAKANATIVLNATADTPGLQALVRELESMGARACVIAGDLTDPSFPDVLVRDAALFCDGLDAVVSNAGAVRPGRLDEVSLDDWEFMFSLNARATWLLARAAFHPLRDSGGALVATGSISGTGPHRHQGAYPASKAALIVMCQQLALEWSGHGIRVNVVSPGPTRTAMNARIYADPERVAQRRADIPLGRLGEPEDVAQAIVFLLGHRAAFITGQNLVVDGGLLMSSLDRIGAVRRRDTQHPSTP